MDTALLSALINLGAGFIVVILIIFGFLVPKPSVDRLLRTIERLESALALERQRSDDAASAAAVTNQLLGAMRSLAEQQGSRDRDRDRRELERGEQGRDAEV